MKNSKLLLTALVLVVTLGSLADLANAKRKETLKVPTRVSFSGNFVGELEPCG